MHCSWCPEDEWIKHLSDFPLAKKQLCHNTLSYFSGSNFSIISKESTIGTIYVQKQMLLFCCFCFCLPFMPQSHAVVQGLTRVGAAGFGLWRVVQRSSHILTSWDLNSYLKYLFYFVVTGPQVIRINYSGNKTHNGMSCYVDARSQEVCYNLLHACRKKKKHQHFALRVPWAVYDLGI